MIKFYKDNEVVAKFVMLEESDDPNKIVELMFQAYDTALAQSKKELYFNDEDDHSYDDAILSNDWSKFNYVKICDNLLPRSIMDDLFHGFLFKEDIVEEIKNGKYLQ